MMILKDTFTQKLKVCRHQLSPLPMESRVQFCSQQNILKLKINIKRLHTA